MRVTNGFEFFEAEDVHTFTARHQQAIEGKINSLDRDDVLDADRSQLRDELVEHYRLEIPSLGDALIGDELDIPLRRCSWSR